MAMIFDMLVMLLLLANFRLLVSSRLQACIQTVAMQAVLLAAMTLATPHGRPWAMAGLALTTVAVKAVLLPWLLRRAIREAGVRREIEPLVGFTVSLLLGAVLLGLCFVISSPLRQAAPPGTLLLIPSAMFTMLTGLFLIVSRRKALTQVLGYLTLENGVYAFGTALAVEEPWLLELAILLDVLAAVFVMGITMYHIHRAFDHIDTDRLSQLKD